MVLMGCSSSEKPVQQENVTGVEVIIKEGDEPELGTPIMLLSSKGDTIAPMGKYGYAGELTGSDLKMVLTLEKEDKWPSRFALIDTNGKELDYRIFVFDNGPDDISEGMIRIVDNNGKIGYADSLGHLVIAPQFFFAKQWKNGYGQVALDGYLQPDGEHRKVVVKEWQKIDAHGNRTPSNGGDDF